MAHTLLKNNFITYDTHTRLEKTMTLNNNDRGRISTACGRDRRRSSSSSASLKGCTEIKKPHL
jgi:hypothetical protein